MTLNDVQQITADRAKFKRRWNSRDHDSAYKRMVEQDKRAKLKAECDEILAVGLNGKPSRSPSVDERQRHVARRWSGRNSL